MAIIKWGALVSASAAFWVCLDTVESTILFVVQLSLGEAFYSPRVYEYTMIVAPQGLEGLYTQLSAMPMFLAKFLVGPLSGSLLTSYCSLEAGRTLDPTCILPGTNMTNSTTGNIPEGSVSCDACPNPVIMWVILGSMATVAALGIFLFGPCLDVSQQVPGQSEQVGQGFQTLDEELEMLPGTPGPQGSLEDSVTANKSGDEDHYPDEEDLETVDMDAKYQ